MHMSTIDTHGINNSGGKVPLLRIVKSIPMERLRWLMMVVIVLATVVLFLTYDANRTTIVELLLLFSLVLLAI
jgi:hypothetical protein